jgi:hypothetical protein
MWCLANANRTFTSSSDFTVFIRWRFFTNPWLLWSLGADFLFVCFLYYNGLLVCSGPHQPSLLDLYWLGVAAWICFRSRCMVLMMTRLHFVVACSVWIGGGCCRISWRLFCFVIWCEWCARGVHLWVSGRCWGKVVSDMKWDLLKKRIGVGGSCRFGGVGWGQWLRLVCLCGEV